MWLHSAAIVESSMQLPQKIKNVSAFSPSDPTSGNISEETQHTIFIAALFIITKIWKQPKCPPLDEWVEQLTM